MCTVPIRSARTLRHHGLPDDAIHAVFQAVVVAKRSAENFFAVPPIIQFCGLWGGPTLKTDAFWLILKKYRARLYWYKRLQIQLVQRNLQRVHRIEYTTQAAVLHLLVPDNLYILTLHIACSIVYLST